MRTTIDNPKRQGSHSKRAEDGFLLVHKVKKCPYCGKKKIFEKRGVPICTSCGKEREDIKKVGSIWQ